MMPGMDGVTALDELKKIDDDLPVLMITAYASVENAIAAMKRGAFDYISKPFKNDEVLVVLQNAIERRQLEPLRRRRGQAHLVAFARQQRLEDLAHDLLVVDDQNRGAGDGHASVLDRPA